MSAESLQFGHNFHRLIRHNCEDFLVWSMMTFRCTVIVLGTTSTFNYCNYYYFVCSYTS